MIASMVALYPSIPITWGALLIALAYWSRREPAKRSLMALSVLLSLTVVCVAAGGALVGDPGVPFNTDEVLKITPVMSILAAVLVIPAGAVGALVSTWLTRRGSSWRVAFAASAAVAVIISTLAFPALGMVLPVPCC